MNDHVKETEDRLIADWEAKKGDKRKIYLQHFFLWGIGVFNLAYLFSIDFQFANFSWKDYLLRFVVWGVGSQLLAKLKIRTHERQYRKIMERRANE